MLNDMLNSKGMIDADSIIMSGGSAGGVAAFIWADYLKDLLKPGTKYWAAPDSGYAVNSPNAETGTLLIKD